MGSGNYESQILEAIQILVDDAVSKANYDKTIQGTISRCVDATIGKYIVRYQDSSFYAYSHNTETTYPAGSSVYVLVPGNDMSKEKSIIGTVDHLGPDYVSIIEGENGYEVTGVNTINADGTFGLCSYKKEDLKVLYDRDNDVDLVGLDVTGFGNYIKNSTSIICGATFKTALDSAQKYRGDYGIVFHLDFTDKSTGEVVTKSYIVNVDQMTGNPYNYTVASRQYGIFDVDGANFISVKQIYLFAYDFPNTAEDKENDIFVSKVELSAANALDKEAAATCALTFVTPQGTYFDETNLDTDTKTLQAQIRIKGNAIDNDSQNVDYYWFRENNNISTKSEKYNQYGGAGWECLNNYSVVQSETEDNEAVVQWTRGNYQYITEKADNVARETTYKCVAVYFDGTILSRTIVIYNYSSDYEISIASDSGTAFNFDLGKPTLTCYVNGEEETSNIYDYVWSVINNNNQFSVLEETATQNEQYNNAVIARDALLEKINAEQLLTAEDKENLDLYNQIIKQYEYIMRIDANKIHNLKINTITNFSTYKCSVYKSGIFIGTASIIITNGSQTENNKYTLVINNGNQVFKYNEKGISPANGSMKNPITIMPLSFTLFDDKGQQINHNVIKKIEWKVPRTDSLINVSITHDTPVENTDGTDSYFNVPELNFGIRNTYSAVCDKNQIQLTITYDNQVISAYTNLTFVKEGEVGTNGTDFVCKIIPNTEDPNAPHYPTVVYNEYTSQYSLNYTPVDSEKWFKVQLWHDGERIYEGTESGNTTENIQAKVQWMMLQNVYNREIKDSSNFTIDKDTAEITFDDSVYENPSNIVKCIITYNEVDYYATLPITIIRVVNEDYEVQLLENSGFREVMYTTDGQTPAYDNQPFELMVSQIVEGVKNDISRFNTSEFAVNYNWEVRGNVYYSDWQLERNLLRNTLRSAADLRNQISYKPIDTYNGLCVNNALVCDITRNNIKLASVHIPIHFYINRYGNAALNGWDGNSISLDEEGGIILAPQVGAGKKNEDNTFTGVFMGSVKEPGAEKEEHGLFGYNSGQRTITLNSEDGSARFGKTGAGQIIIDPSTGEALLTSGNFDEDAGTGMEINLSEPSIKFGSGNFEVDKNGQIWATQYATKNMKFDSSSVDGLDDRLDGLDTTVEDLNSTINYLDVVLPTNNVTVETNTSRVPTHTATKTIECIATYKGTVVRPTVRIEGSHPGITNVSSSYDTERGVIILSFYVDSNQAITDATNNYNIIFSYNQADCSPVTKIVSVLVIEKGKDGTSVNIKGSETNITTLCENHSSNNTIGDGYILADNGEGISGHLFIFTNDGGGNGSLAADWKDVGKIQGQDGVDGRGVQSITYEYLTTNSSIKPDASDSRWQDIMEVPTNNKRYLWQKETITFVEIDGQHTTQDTVLLLAVYGEAGTGIQSTEVGYQIWTDGTTIPTGTWLTDPPETSAGDYLWTRIRITYTTGEPIDSYSITYIGKDGKIGADGRGIKSTAIDYIGSTSGTAKPADGENWTSTIPTVAQGNYLWTRTTITYTDNETTKSYSVSRIGTDGANGVGIESVTNKYAVSNSNSTAPATWYDTPQTMTVDNKYLWNYEIVTYTNNSTDETDPRVIGVYGTSGSDGKGIKSIKEFYQVSDSNSTAPNTWSETVVSMTATNKYLWSYEKITYTDNSYTDTDPRVIGVHGTDGTNGRDGKGIVSTTIDYQASSSGTVTPTGTWSTTIPSVSAGQFLWTRTTIKYTEGSDSVSYSVGKMGNNGSNGANGTSITIKSTSVTYQTSTSGTTAPTGTWLTTVPTVASGQYLWTKTEVTYSDDQKTTAYSVSYKGTDGANGTNGTSVTISSKAIEYQTSTSGTVTPTGTWSITIPSVAKGQYLWTRTTVTYSTGDQVVSYSVAYQGTNGTNGTNGTDGKDGTSVTVRTTSTTYQTSSSPTTVPTGTWSNSVVATDTTKKYLWTKVVVTFSDDKEAVSYSVSSTMDSIEVGSRNLLLGSDSISFEASDTSSKITRENQKITIVDGSGNTNAYKWVTEQLSISASELNAKVGECLALSVDVKTTGWTSGTISFSFNFREGGSNVLNATKMYANINDDGKWIRLKGSIFTANGNIDQNKVLLLYTGSSVNNGTIIEYKNFKIEKGNVSTDWSPAPEDTEEDITKASSAAASAESKADDAKQAADAAIEQAGNASKAVESLSESHTQLAGTVTTNQNNSIKSVEIQYCQKPYQWARVTAGSAYAEGTIYYKQETINNKTVYTKIRPDIVDGKIQQEVWKKNGVTEPTAADKWQTSRPAWIDGEAIYQRTLITPYVGDPVPSAHFLMDDYQTVDDLRYLDSANILSEMRGKNYIFYNEDGLFVYDGATKNESKNAIVINNQGICFQHRDSTADAWPTPTSVWTIDGTFNAQDILVTNLNAESIVDGVLTLGNGGRDGELLIKDDTNTILTELSAQRTMWSLNGQQYVIIGKDCGFQMVDNSGKQKYGNSLVWSSKITTGTYQNNTNYYTEPNLLKLIPETTKDAEGKVISTIVGTTIPATGVYTVSYQEAFEVAEQKISGSTNYGGYIQTVNINTTDERDYVHRGLAFVPKR